MTQQQATMIANDLQALRAKLKAASEAADDVEAEAGIDDAIGWLDLAEEALVDANVIPVVASR